MKLARRIAALASPLVMVCGFVMPGAAAGSLPTSSLDRGFRFLYNFAFDRAQSEFAAYQRERGADPLGPAAEAAGLLFQELNRLGILEAQFFVKDTYFKNRARSNPDPLIRARFEQALARADSLARTRLKRSPQDKNALLAMTLEYGLRADYASLVLRHNVAALQFTGKATESAHALLAVCPNCYDAYVATGISEYLSGSFTAPVRWMLRLRGYAADKQHGIGELELAAGHGHYLAPFARILLSIAYLREKQPERSQALLSGLRAEYPLNPVFARELARLRAGGESRSQ
jgi:hypothetical protein